VKAASYGGAMVAECLIFFLELRAYLVGGVVCSSLKQIVATTQSVASKIKGTLMENFGTNESMTCEIWC
jgi:hypothetical protein